MFYMSLLKQDTSNKGRVNKSNVTELNTNDNNSKEYKIEAI